MTWVFNGFGEPTEPRDTATTVRHGICATKNCFDRHGICASHEINGRCLAFWQLAMQNDRRASEPGGVRTWGHSGHSILSDGAAVFSDGK